MTWTPGTLATQDLTIQLPSELTEQAKIVAAKRGTSLSALLQAAVEEIVRFDDEYAAAGQRFLASSVSCEFKKTWTRDDLHERRWSVPRAF